MKKQIYLNQKGITSTDIIISVTIIMLFVAVITTSFYNYYQSIQSKNRATIATNVIIDIIESVEMLPYDEINQTIIDDLIQNLKIDGTIQNAYNVTATIQNYNEQEGNEDKKDLIKVLTLKVTYTNGKKEENVEITRLITK